MLAVDGNTDRATFLRAILRLVHEDSAFRQGVVTELSACRGRGSDATEARTQHVFRSRRTGPRGTCPSLAGLDGAQPGRRLGLSWQVFAGTLRPM